MSSFIDKMTELLEEEKRAKRRAEEFEKELKCFICNTNPKDNTKALIYCVREIKGEMIAFCPCTNKNHTIEQKNWKYFLNNHDQISIDDYKFRCFALGWFALPNMIVEGGEFNVDSTI